MVVYPGIELLKTAEDIEGYRKPPLKPGLQDEWVYRKEIRRLPAKTGTDTALGSLGGAIVGAIGGAIVYGIINNEPSDSGGTSYRTYQPPREWSAQEKEELYLVTGISGLGGAVVGAGIAFFINLASASMATVKDRVDESKVETNKQKLDQWEKEKEEVGRHNTELLRKENRKIEAQNVERNKVEIENIDTGKIDIVKFN